MAGLSEGQVKPRTLRKSRSRAEKREKHIFLCPSPLFSAYPHPFPLGPKIWGRALQKLKRTSEAAKGVRIGEKYDQWCLSKSAWLVVIQCPKAGTGGGPNSVVIWEVLRKLVDPQLVM